MKREMTTWNIYELMKWFGKCVDRIYPKNKIEIRNGITDSVSSDRYWYKWIYKVLNEIVNIQSIWILVSN